LSFRGRQVFETLGYYNPGLRQLPDFDMWIRLVKHFPIHVIQENLVAHLRDGNNTSAVSPENSARNLTELVEIFGSFFESLSDDVFIDGFSEYFRLKGVPATQARLEAEKFFLLLDSAFVQASGKAAALALFIKRCADPEFERVLRDEYMFSVFDFYRITGQTGFGHFLMAAHSASIPVSTSVDGVSASTLSQGRFIYFLKRVLRRLRRELRRISA
ncbi:hypothetical protein YA0850_16905, partial [Pseudomonas veronii]|nr:hypothetical protein [Pseudomonas veronii]MBI6653955.1 hypothetical protein [Pseudomonas veronii]